MNHKALNQLLCAALVNQDFCQTLLNNAAEAISTGYLGNKFNLTLAEKDLLLTIHARTLEDFAGQVSDWIASDKPIRTISTPQFNNFPFSNVPERDAKEVVLHHDISYLC